MHPLCLFLLGFILLLSLSSRSTALLCVFIVTSKWPSPPFPPQKNPHLSFKNRGWGWLIFQTAIQYLSCWTLYRKQQTYNRIKTSVVKYSCQWFDIVLKTVVEKNVIYMKITWVKFYDLKCTFVIKKMYLSINITSKGKLIYAVFCNVWILRGNDQILTFQIKCLNSVTKKNKY